MFFAASFATYEAFMKRSRWCMGGLSMDDPHTHWTRFVVVVLYDDFWSRFG